MEDLRPINPSGGVDSRLGFTPLHCTAVRTHDERLRFGTREIWIEAKDVKALLLLLLLPVAPFTFLRLLFNLKENPTDLIESDGKSRGRGSNFVLTTTSLQYQQQQLNLALLALPLSFSCHVTLVFSI